VKKLNVLKEGRPQRNAAGDITLAASYQSREVPVARIEPNRKWFTNTRVIAQESLTQFREAIAKNANDPYSYLLKSNKLPMSLIRDDETKNGVKVHQAKVAVEQRPFKDTFGPKAQRKRVKLDISSIEDLAGHSVKMHDTFLEKEEQAALLSGALGQETAGTGVLTSAIEPIFSKGQSKRIWNELYKVWKSEVIPNIWPRLIRHPGHRLF
jgi:nuclear GTP-binding protein